MRKQKTTPPTPLAGVEIKNDPPQVLQVARTISESLHRAVVVAEVEQAADLIRRRLAAADVADAYLHADPLVGDVELALLDINAQQAEADGHAELAEAYRRITSMVRTMAPQEEGWKGMVAAADRATGAGRMDEALEIMWRCAGQFPKQAEVHALLAMMLSVRQEYPEALEVLQRAIACSPEDARLHAMREAILTLQAAPPAAASERRDTKSEAELDREQILGMAGIISAKIRRAVRPEEVEHAAGLIQRRLALPDAIAAYVHADPPVRDVELAILDLYAERAEAAGRIDASEKYRRITAAVRTMAPQENGWQGMVAAADRATGEGRMDDALEIMTRCAGRYPNQAEVHALLATLLSVRQKYPEATEALQRAIACSPGDARLYAMLGSLMSLQGNLPAAVSAYTRALQIDPENKVAQTNLEAVNTPQNSTPNINFHKTELIDYTYTHCLPAPTSFADLGGIWGVDGAYTFYTLQKYGAEHAVLVDFCINDATIQKSQSEKRLRLIQGNFGEETIVEQVGIVDAVFLFDVLLHQVQPDWNEILALYSAHVKYFVVYNQQWVGSEKTVRLLDLGRDEYFRNVPHDPNHPNYKALFEKMNEISPDRKHIWRDISSVWQ